MAPNLCRPFFIITVLILSIFSTTIYATCTKAEVENADLRWANAIDSNNVDKVVSLYANKAVLLATVHTPPIVTRAGRIAYFDKFFRTYKHAQVVYDGTKYIQIFNGGAVSSGLYTFSGIKNEHPVKVHARYTFVYRSTTNGCELITHHSSEWPE